MVDQNNMQTPPPVSGGVDNDKLMGILSYLGILVLIPLFATTNRSSFLNFHVNQGVNLIIVWIIGYVVLAFVPVLLMLMPIWQLLMLVMVILGIINVSKGETKALPVIGNIFHLVK